MSQGASPAGPTSPLSDQALPGLSPAQRDAMRALGHDWARDIQGNRKQVCEIYDAVHAALPADGMQRVAGLAYGSDPRQQLDLYLPPDATPASALPVVVFVHGGAFLRGNKDASPYIYANVPRLFARLGYVGVNLEYRLAPQAPYPAGAQDVVAALAWLRASVDAYGGDARRIVLIGHSAGGSHVASALSDPLFDGEAAGVAGAVLVSARLQADTLPDNPNAGGVVAYYGADSAQQQQRAPMAFAQRLTAPLMVVFAEHENPYLDLYALQYAARVAKAQRRAPRVVQVPHHNHTSVVAHLGSADTALADALSGFIESVVTHRAASK
ncbi:alpha/beta hydrolase [Cupriavidus sp. YAF13]|uniref:alpha/beta hydrolase n=1 Tax=Cupriavidus sp. YAF13 TaxID=3233075 RepID=UPI003F8E7F0E